jgi:hypothetical protein
MVPVPVADSLEDLNRMLLEACLSYGGHRIAGREHTVNELYEEEKEHLLSLPDMPFSNIETAGVKVDKYATVVVDKNRYSVPSSYAYFKVNVVLHVDCVEAFYGSKKIASHDRLYGNNKWSLLPEHYLELIAQRPQAFESARVIRQWRPNWPFCLERLLERFCQKQGHTKGIKDFISVLMLYKDHAAGDIASAVEKALLSGAGSSEAVEHILIHKESDDEQSFSALDNWQSLPPPDVSVYGQIGGAL